MRSVRLSLVFIKVVWSRHGPLQTIVTKNSTRKRIPIAIRFSYDHTVYCSLVREYLFIAWVMDFLGKRCVNTGSMGLTARTLLGHCLGSVVGWCGSLERSTLVRVYHTGACWLDKQQGAICRFAGHYLWAEEHGFLLPLLLFPLDDATRENGKAVPSNTFTHLRGFRRSCTLNADLVAVPAETIARFKSKTVMQLLSSSGGRDSRRSRICEDSLVEAKMCSRYTRTSVRNKRHGR